MKRHWIAIAILAASGAALADNYHRGYVRSDGTYVQPHMQSAPNSSRFDNYSARDNINPYTGQRGSQRHEFTDPPQFNSGRNLDSPFAARRLQGEPAPLALVIRLSVLVAAALALAACGPRNFEECRREAATLPTELGVKIALGDCYKKFPTPPSQ